MLSKPADLDSSSDNYIDYVITKPGWYDFTQVGGSGDGAKYVTVTQEIDGSGDANRGRGAQLQPRHVRRQDPRR